MNEAHIRELAWTGDAVLSLYARQWLLMSQHLNSQQRAEYFIHISSNQFLSALGKPTEVEARIGKRYEDEGLASAFEYITTNLVPLFLSQLKNKRLPLPHTDAPSAK